MISRRRQRPRVVAARQLGQRPDGIGSRAAHASASEHFLPVRVEEAMQAAEAAHQAPRDAYAKDWCQQTYIVLHVCMLGVRGMRLQSNNLSGTSDFAALAISSRL